MVQAHPEAPKIEKARIGTLLVRDVSGVFLFPRHPTPNENISAAAAVNPQSTIPPHNSNMSRQQPITKDHDTADMIGTTVSSLAAAETLPGVCHTRLQGEPLPNHGSADFSGGRERVSRV